MAHCEAEVLALVALGEPVGDPDRDHLLDCDECRGEVARLSAAVDVARRAPRVLDEPPAQVWARVQDEIASSSAPVVLERRRPRWPALAVAAAAVAVALAGGFVLGRSAGEPPAASQIAAAPLTAPDGAGGALSGSALLLEHDGAFSVEVDAIGMPAAQGFYEVWLMDPVNAGLVSLGTMSAGQTHATFPVPAGLPLTQFTSIDISDEPFDGNPGHSAGSLLRGQFSL